MLSVLIVLTFITCACILCAKAFHFPSFHFSRSLQNQYEASVCSSSLNNPVEVRIGQTALFAKKKKKSRQKRLEQDLGETKPIFDSNDSGSFSGFTEDTNGDISEADDGDDSEAMAKLKAEAAAPFRLFRTFIYGAIGAAGGLGTVTNIPQLIFAFQDPDGDKINAVQNLAIDLGGVIGALVLWNRERQGEQKQLAAFTEKQRRQDNRLAPAALEAREKQLGMLPVEIQISEFDENATRIVSLADLQLKGKQNVVIVSGEFEFVRDAVLSARLAGSDLFAAEETVVIPFVKSEQQLDEGKEKGFGSQETLMTAPYIAKPQQVREEGKLILFMELD